MYQKNKNCYHKPEKIFEIESVEYFASNADLVSKFIGDVVINFTKYPNLPLKTFPEIFSEFDLGFREEIIVPWPDFDIPKVKISFWNSLHKFIISNGWKKACLHCAGGHGRTGTALSALLIVHNKMSAYDAVCYVRENYCNEAVETFKQFEYLQSLDFHYNGRKDYNQMVVTSDIFDKMKNSSNEIEKYNNDYEWEDWGNCDDYEEYICKDEWDIWEDTDKLENIEDNSCSSYTQLNETIESKYRKVNKI
jgi:protein-tyrosine phosphatase